MTSQSRLLMLLLLVCVATHGLGISLPAIFGGLISKGDSEADDEYREEDASLDQQEKKPTTHKPPLLHIPHPADTPLNPNNPHHPFHPDNRPHFPQLPSLPHFTRETIRATKTVFVEVTDRVTVHPVCMATHKLTPPCLPYHPHQQGHYYHREGDLQNEGEEATPASPAAPAIEPTKAAQPIEPTAAPHLLEPTRILGGVSVSEDPDSSVEDDEGPQASAPEARQGRYIDFTPLLSDVEDVEIKDDSPAEHSFSPINVVQNLLHRSPVTLYKTKTLWVTKVEKVLDTRVTATLLPKNCVPTNSHIPLCAPHGGLFIPGYHGYLGEGIYSESHGGNFGAATYVGKERGEQNSKNNPQQQRLGDQSEYEDENNGHSGEVEEI